LKAGSDDREGRGLGIKGCKQPWLNPSVVLQKARVKTSSRHGRRKASRPSKTEYEESPCSGSSQISLGSWDRRACVETHAVHNFRLATVKWIFKAPFGGETRRKAARRAIVYNVGVKCVTNEMVEASFPTLQTQLYSLAFRHTLPHPGLQARPRRRRPRRQHTVVIIQHGVHDRSGYSVLLCLRYAATRVAFVPRPPSALLASSSRSSEYPSCSAVLFDDRG
jgi:hypothetical protein